MIDKTAEHKLLSLMFISPGQQASLNSFSSSLLIYGGNSHRIRPISSPGGRSIKSRTGCDARLKDSPTQTPGGTHDIFAHGCATYGLYIDFLWNFLRKSRTLFEIFVPNENTILGAVLGKKVLPFSKNFPKIVDF